MLRPENDLATLLEWREQFVRDWIAPLVLDKGRALVTDHRRRNHRIAIVTSTNAFITRPIAEALGIPDLLACEGEIVDGLYTGEPAGIPSFGKGKVTRLQQWLATRDINLDGARDVATTIGSSAIAIV